jgi:aconitate hydratase
MGFFPIDGECVRFLRATGRTEEHCQIYENYYRAQGLFGMPKQGEIQYSVELALDLATVVPSVAGPKRPQDRIELPNLKREFQATFTRPVNESGFGRRAFSFPPMRVSMRAAAARSRCCSVRVRRTTPTR